MTLTGSGGNSTVDTTGGNISLSGNLSGIGGLIKVGFGTLTLSASNGYTGVTLVSNGTLLLSNSAALAGSTFDSSGTGSLSFGTSASTYTAAAFGGIARLGQPALNNATSAALALTAGGNNANTTFSGGLSGSGSLTKVGLGTLTVTGVNTYQGNTTVSAGTLRISGGYLPAANENVEGRAQASSWREEPMRWPTR